MVYPQLPAPPPPIDDTPKGRQGLAIAAAVVVVALASVAGVVVARSTSDNSTSAASTFADEPGATDGSDPSANGVVPRANLDHFHAAYAINLCGVEQPPLSDAHPDVHGIHTHTDGVIHVHPFDQTVAGERAILSTFFQQVDVRLTDTTLTLPSGETRTEGRDTCGGNEAELVVLVWANANDADAGRPPDETHTTDVGRVRLRQGEAISIAFRARDTPVSGPANAVDRLARLNDAPPTTRGQTTSTTRPTATSTS